MKIFSIILGILIVVVAIFGLWFNRIVSLPISQAANRAVLTIDKGDGVKAVADKLLEAELIRARWHWNMYILLTGKRSNILVGEYELKRNQSIREIARIVTTEPEEEEVEVKLIEGWTAEAMADVLDQAGVISKEEFLAAVEAADPKGLFGKTYAFLDGQADKSLEGYLFPDTYRFFVPSTAAQVLQKMLDNFDQKYTATLRQAVAASGRTTYETVTLASIVERELKTDRDRAMAADLFLRRIAEGIPLQSDATVNYVTGKSSLRPSLTDLEFDSPYNTYKYRGLPPGPISNPGLSALRATANPETNPYFYFLTGTDGKTYWARTLEEHVQNRVRYLQ